MNQKTKAEFAAAMQDYIAKASFESYKSSYQQVWQPSPFVQNWNEPTPQQRLDSIKGNLSNHFGGEQDVSYLQICDLVEDIAKNRIPQMTIIDKVHLYEDVFIQLRWGNEGLEEIIDKLTQRLCFEPESLEKLVRRYAPLQSASWEIAKLAKRIK